MWVATIRAGMGFNLRLVKPRQDSPNPHRPQRGGRRSWRSPRAMTPVIATTEAACRWADVVLGDDGGKNPSSADGDELRDDRQILGVDSVEMDRCETVRPRLRFQHHSHRARVTRHIDFASTTVAFAAMECSRRTAPEQAPRVIRYAAGHRIAVHAGDETLFRRRQSRGYLTPSKLTGRPFVVEVPGCDGKVENRYAAIRRRPGRGVREAHGQASQGGWAFCLRRGGVLPE